jgi:hypothetical protein
LHSTEISEIAKALSKVQSVLEGASKSSVNPHFKSKYSDLRSIWDSLRDILPENGLSVTQIMSPIDGRDYMITMLMHTSGQWIKSVLPLMIEKVTSQGLGSAISYSRRYALAAIVGVYQEDDDGNAATFISRKQVAELVSLLKGHSEIHSHLMTQLAKTNTLALDKIQVDDYEKIYAMVDGWVKKKTEKLEENKDEGEQ